MKSQQEGMRLRVETHRAKYKTSMKIVILGGTGQVGSILSHAFRNDGHDVIIISRHPNISAQEVKWDGKTLGPWVNNIDGTDVVINLAGHTVNCRYTKRNRDLIMKSRMDSTRVVGEAIRRLTNPPHLWIQASTATIYAHRFDAPNDEAGIIGGSEGNAPASWKFSIDVAKAWERELDRADVTNTRKIKLRSAMVMSPNRGGIFDVLLGLVRWRLGGRSGNGRQYVSWIHYEDFIRAIYWLIEHKEIDGVVNVSSPHPLPNSEFMKAIRAAWGIRLGLPATKWMLEFGAIFLKTETELILKSRRVIPGLLVQKGFTFRYPIWSQASIDLCQKIRSQTANGVKPPKTRLFF